MLEQAVILVGGMGSRLGLIASTTPKPLLKVAGRPFIEHLLQEISRYGFRRVTLLAGNLGSQFASAYDGSSFFGMDLEVVIEPGPLGTAGALCHASRIGGLDPSFILLNGDSWIDSDLTQFSITWDRVRKENSRVQALILLQERKDTGRYGLVGVNNGLVTSFFEKRSNASGAKSVSGMINAGMYVLDRDILACLAPGQAVSLENYLLPKIVADGRVAAFTASPDAYFIDIGIPETFRESQFELLRHRRRPAIFFDRDGTLNHDTGYTYRIQDLVWINEAREAIKFCNDAGWFVFVVTNQSGVARGYYGENEVSAFHRGMQRDLYALGAHIDAYRFCPHHPGGQVKQYSIPCRCRKPGPGMIEELASSWPIEMENSVLIGNSTADMAAAEAANVKGLLYSGGSLLELVKASMKLSHLNVG